MSSAWERMHPADQRVGGPAPIPDHALDFAANPADRTVALPPEFEAADAAVDTNLALAESTTRPGGEH